MLLDLPAPGVALTLPTAIPPPTDAEIVAASNWLRITISRRTDRRLRLPTAMRLVKETGHQWRAVIAARRLHGFLATREDADGEWVWRLPPGEAKI